MSFFAPNWAGALSLLFPFTRRHSGGDDPGPEDLWSTGPSSAALLASGEISEHNSMGFFGVKKRHPYPLGQRTYRVKAIIEMSIRICNG